MKPSQKPGITSTTKDVKDQKIWNQINETTITEVVAAIEVSVNLEPECDLELNSLTLEPLEEPGSINTKDVDNLTNEGSINLETKISFKMQSDYPDKSVLHMYNLETTTDKCESTKSDLMDNRLQDTNALDSELITNLNDGQFD